MLEYVAIAVLVVLSTLIALIAIGLGTLFGPRKESEAKAMPYESGMTPYGEGTRRMPVRFYLIAVLFILYTDLWKALWFTNPTTGTVSFGIGVGTLVLATNCVLLSGYLFGCHSLRHVVGGCVDQFSRAPLGLRAYSCVSCLNRKHMVWAWCSLFTVGFSDLYVRLCSMGVWPDLRIF